MDSREAKICTDEPLSGSTFPSSERPIQHKTHTLKPWEDTIPPARILTKAPPPSLRERRRLLEEVHHDTTRIERTGPILVAVRIRITNGALPDMFSIIDRIVHRTTPKVIHINQTTIPIPGQQTSSSPRPWKILTGCSYSQGYQGTRSSPPSP